MAKGDDYTESESGALCSNYGAQVLQYLRGIKNQTYLAE